MTGATPRRDKSAPADMLTNDMLTNETPSMAMFDDSGTVAVRPEPEPEPGPTEPPERVQSVEQFVESITSERLSWRDEERPPYELLGGFVFKMRAEGLYAAKPSEYRGRYEAFLKE